MTKLAARFGVGIALLLAAAAVYVYDTSTIGAVEPLWNDERPHRVLTRTILADDRPHVGLLIALNENDDPVGRCTGTLLSPTVFLTAGHCLAPPATSVAVWFGDDVRHAVPIDGHPFEGEVNSASIEVHPDYDEESFLHDLGVAVLEEPVILDAYGELPRRGALDGAAGLGRITVEAVVYCLRFVPPGEAQGSRGGSNRTSANPHLIRMRGSSRTSRYAANPRLIRTDAPGAVGDFRIEISGDASTGGTCVGDAGGLLFLDRTDTVVGVTSYGINPSRATDGGSYRIDISADDLAFVRSFL